MLSALASAEVEKIAAPWNARAVTKLFDIDQLIAGSWPPTADSDSAGLPHICLTPGWCPPPGALTVDMSGPHTTGIFGLRKRTSDVR